MLQSLNKDTLAYQLGMRPALQHRDMGSLPVSGVVVSLNKLFDADDIYVASKTSSKYSETVMGVPENDAVIFYLLNHAMSMVRQRVHVYEPLGKYQEIVEMYHTELAARATRMFSYMLLICTRESRHDHSSGGLAYAKLEGEYGSNIIKFHKSLKGLTPTTAADAFKKSPPLSSIGTYTRFLSDLFYTGSFHTGYGGKAWGKVADVLRDYVNGTLTAEMMMDTAYTLCHNNGPIFNKGMLFSHHTDRLTKILDVQRSGQIPQYVADTPSVSAVASIKSMWCKCHDLLGSEFSGYVDWFKVEDLGALKSYPKEKAAQIASYGYPSHFKAKQALETAKSEAQAVQKLKTLKSKIEICPGQFITKVGRPV